MYAKGNEDNANSDLFGIRFRDAVCRRPAGERNVLSQATGDTLECAYVFDEVSVSELLGMTIPHRTLGRGWHTAVFVTAFAFTRQARGQSLVENACEGNFRGLTAKLRPRVPIMELGPPRKVQDPEPSRENKRLELSLVRDRLHRKPVERTNWRYK
jgi:hypothetical protein